MKLSEFADQHYKLAERNIEADVVVVIDGKEVAVVTSREVTERGKTRVVLVPAKPRASRSKSKEVPRGPIDRMTEDEKQTLKDIWSGNIEKEVNNDNTNDEIGSAAAV